MRIPESKIDEIRRSVDIVDVISDYVRLNASGRNFKALSPFTNEKTPSFYVSSEKQIYKCFSSGKGGNVFTFVMEMEKLGFIDAVKFVAKRAGIDLSEFERASRDHQPSKEELTQYDVLTWAAKFFHNALNTPEGKECFAYLRERGLFPETISHFGLGYAYDDWNKLYDQAQKDNISIDFLKELGLVSHSEKADKYYDTFRGRAMFPIFSSAGKVVGFGGRILTGQKNTPKYINSPESKLYEKSKLLYAMNFAKDEIRRQDEAILVEGYMDVISLHQAGLKNVVASSGTSLTPEQAKLIGRFSKNVVFIYDGDSAGIKAMMRGIDILLEQGLSPSIVSLPGNSDPDSYVLEVGGEQFRKYIQDHKIPFLDFKIDVLKQSEGFETPEKSADSIKELVGTIVKIQDELEREIYIKTLGSKIDVSFGILQKEADKLLGRTRRHLRDRHAISEQAPQTELQHTGQRISEPKEDISVSERTFLKALMESTYHGPTVIEFVISHQDFFKFQSPSINRVVKFIIDRYQHVCAVQEEYAFDFPNEITYIDDEELRNFISELLIDTPISSRWPTESASDYARRCVTAFLDSTSKLILSQYHEARTNTMRALDKETNLEKQQELITSLNQIRKQELDAKRIFEDTIRTLLSSS